MCDHEVDFDHENFLGHSLEEIAREKAGIIKENVPVVLAEQKAEAAKVILSRAAELNALPMKSGRNSKTHNLRWKRMHSRGCRRSESGTMFHVAPKLAREISAR